MAEGAAESAAAVGEHHLLCSWRSIVFVPAGDGQRRRAAATGVRLAVAVLALGCCLLLIRFDSRIDRAERMGLLASVSRFTAAIRLTPGC